jgi:hypothetical protein
MIASTTKLSIILFNLLIIERIAVNLRLKGGSNSNSIAVNDGVTAMAVALVRHKCNMITGRMRTADLDYTESYGRIIGEW